MIAWWGCYPFVLSYFFSHVESCLHVGESHYCAKLLLAATLRLLAQLQYHHYSFRLVALSRTYVTPCPSMSRPGWENQKQISTKKAWREQCWIESVMYSCIMCDGTQNTLQHRMLRKPGVSRVSCSVDTTRFRCTPQIRSQHFSLHACLLHPRATCRYPEGPFRPSGALEHP